MRGLIGSGVGMGKNFDSRNLLLGILSLLILCNDGLVVIIFAESKIGAGAVDVAVAGRSTIAGGWSFRIGAVWFDCREYWVLVSDRRDSSHDPSLSSSSDDRDSTLWFLRSALSNALDVVFLEFRVFKLHVLIALPESHVEDVPPTLLRTFFHEN